MELDDSSVTRLQELRLILNLLARTTIDLLLERKETTCDVRSMAIQDGGVAGSDLTRI
jgi:hypothetical protein